VGVSEATDVGIDAVEEGRAEPNEEALTEDAACGAPAEGLDKAATTSNLAASLDVQEPMLSMVLKDQKPELSGLNRAAETRFDDITRSRALHW
jgi:hypothetical protein